MLEADCSPVDLLNPMGEVAGGRLLIRGHIHKCLILGTTIRRDELELIPTEDGFHIRLDDRLSLASVDSVDEVQDVFCLTIGAYSPPSVSHSQTLNGEISGDILILMLEFGASRQSSSEGQDR